MPDAPVKVDERGLLTASDRAWELAKRRSTVIGALVVEGVVSVGAADAAAVELGITRRHVYNLVHRWRCGTGVVSDMLPGSSGGGAGSGRLPELVETVVRDVLCRKYQARQRPTAAVVYREITQTCRNKGLRVPSHNAVARRIARLDPVVTVRRREGADAARTRAASGGAPPVVDMPLAQVQMDHTVVDVIVVDEQHRLPIGRPYVTVAIDVCSRSIVGMVLMSVPVPLCTGSRTPLHGFPCGIWLGGADLRSRVRQCRGAHRADTRRRSSVVRPRVGVPVLVSGSVSGFAGQGAPPTVGSGWGVRWMTRWMVERPTLYSSARSARDTSPPA